MFGWFKRKIKTQEHECLNDMEFVLDFNLQLGMDLGGMLGVFTAFSNSERLLNALAELIKLDMEMSRDPRMSEDNRCDVINKSLSKLKGTDKLILSRYFDFFGIAFFRIMKNDAFALKINQPNTFTVMPDIFTFEVLKMACKVAGKQNL